jgi:hypothetical protein
VKRLLYEFHYLGVVADVLREHARRRGKRLGYNL